MFGLSSTVGALLLGLAPDVQVPCADLVISAISAKIQKDGISSASIPYLLLALKCNPSSIYHAKVLRNGKKITRVTDSYLYAPKQEFVVKGFKDKDLHLEYSVKAIAKTIDNTLPEPTCTFEFVVTLSYIHGEDKGEYTCLIGERITHHSRVPKLYRLPVVGSLTAKPK